MPNLTCGHQARSHCKLCGKDHCSNSKCSENSCLCPKSYSVTIDSTYFLYCTDCRENMAVVHCYECGWDVCGNAKVCNCNCWYTMEGGGYHPDRKKVGQTTEDLKFKVAEIDKEMAKMTLVKEELEKRIMEEKW